MTYTSKPTQLRDSLAFLEDIEGLKPKERDLSFKIPLENIEEVGDDG